MRRKKRARLPKGRVGNRIDGFRSGNEFRVPVHYGSGRTTKDPAVCLDIVIKEALDPARVPGECRTLADMSDEEKAALAAEYGAPIVEEPPDTMVTICVAVIGVSDKAVLVCQRIFGANRRPREAWIPRSVIEGGANVVEGPSQELRVPVWLIRERDLRRKSGGDRGPV